MDRDELHDLVMLLKNEIKAGTVKLSSKETVAALNQVRLAEDGKVDPSTVDASVRACALAAAASKPRREMEQMSLRDVQGKYFDMLDDMFGKLFSEMKRHDLNPQQIADAVSSNEAMVTAFNADLPAFADGIRAFWETFGPVVEAHLRDLGSLKSVFGGDIFPSYTSNIACSVGLYMDTIVLPDPLLSLTTIARSMSGKNRFLYVTKHALNALGYRELALADLKPPIVVIAPNHWGLEDSYNAAMTVAGEADTLLHASRMFGRSFSTVAELLTFLNQFADAGKLISHLADPSRLLFDSEWVGTLSQQFERYTREMMPTAGVADIVFAGVLGRMIMANDILLRSSRFGGSPLIDAPTSWQFLQWKYEYDSSGVSAEKRDVLISKELGSSMLGGIPPETLIELRQNGASAELRELIGKGIGEINSASDATISTVGDAVIANVDKAFSEHDRQLRELSSSRKKFYGVDVGRYLVNSGFAIASAVTQSPALAAVGAISQMAGTPSPAEMWKRYQELRVSEEHLRRSPVGTMFRHLKHKFGFSSK
jgi:hypothetical protein